MPSFLAHNQRNRRTNIGHLSPLHSSRAHCELQRGICAPQLRDGQCALQYERACQVSAAGMHRGGSLGGWEPRSRFRTSAFFGRLEGNRPGKQQTQKLFQLQNVWQGKGRVRRRARWGTPTPSLPPAASKARPSRAPSSRAAPAQRSPKLPSPPTAPPLLPPPQVAAARRRLAPRRCPAPPRRACSSPWAAWRAT